MALGWNEIKERAVRFSGEWEGTCNEDADAKPFLVEFFNVFGISQRKVATFEHKIKKLDERDGYIDLLWKGTILIEMKSRGRDLGKAYEQAKDYLPGLKQHELPRYILVSDFDFFRLYDVDENKEYRFQLKDFVNNVQLFGFIAGYQKHVYKAEDPVNIEAAYLMGKLHDALKEAGYTGHELEKYLVRLLFCLFADDTTIFEKKSFEEYLQLKTNGDGTDLGLHLAQIFQVLNTPEDKRQKTLDESLAAFPYVNGQLFEEQLSFASFSSRMRQTLLECCFLDWSKISPAIFGSMFQSVMDANQRHNLGAHYTSEKNILKLIKPLFLDKLWQEFEAVKNNTNKLKQFHRKIASLRFLDPACGCGNFLVITYRELRLLELAILKELQRGQQVTDLESLMLCNVDRFYGIEYEEFPAQIAQVALWLIDHQMNMLISQEFGEYFVRLPLRKSAKIIQGNALRTDWDTILELLPWESKTDREKFDYILGNPPFVGKHLQNVSQKSDMELIFNGLKGAGVLDYVGAWYIKAAQYLQKHNSFEIESGFKTRVAFVSTNSISQGEQVGILWNELFNHYKLKIHFAHNTFKWANEAKGNAGVHVVIIGFSNFEIPEKLIYEYEDIKGEPHERKVKNITPYLVEGKDLVIISKRDSICNSPKPLYGSKPVDDGNFFFNDLERKEFLQIEPNAHKFLKAFLSAKEYLNSESRWCLWLKDCSPSDLKKLPNVLERIEKVRNFRLQSIKPSTRELANYPALFAEIRQPDNNYILIPLHTSENRKYIPFGFFSPDYIVGNSCTAILNASLYQYGILSSIMHMIWVKYVCGRLESRFRYSNDIVYNNFPWPENPNDRQKESIESAAQKVLDVRLEFPGSSLADLYDPLTMPPALAKAHRELDKAVDLAYRPQAFINETKRIEFLFELYDKYTAGLFSADKMKKAR
jgi:type I restriction-modification system DNA methylase subunit